jgi:hypothetical protein
MLPGPVRDLIARFAPQDRPMNAIPQASRRAFLHELTKITGRPLPPLQPIPVSPDVASHDAKLIENGYEPIAVKGKAAVGTGWSTRPNTLDAVGTERAAHLSARSTGLRTGRLVGIDINIVLPEHVAAIKRVADEVLGVTLLERVGAKGAMLCYRNEAPIPKIIVSGKSPGQIEIFGTGGQFVAYGVHPDTGKPYIWTKDLQGGEPLQTPLGQLPEVTPDKLREFAERVRELLEGLGHTDVKVTGGGRADGPVRFEPTVGAAVDATVDIEFARIMLRHLLERGDVAIQGQLGDDRTYKVACMLRDMGLSAETALELLMQPGGWNERCVPPWTRHDLAIKVRNAYKYGQNAPGAYANPFGPLEPEQPEAAGAATSAQVDKLVERFRVWWPDEYEALPELGFWDDDKTLPRSPDGCIAIVYGEYGAHKTNTVLAMVLDAVLGEGARAVYAAGEGAHGVGKQRVPAHCEARGITTRELRGRLGLVGSVPLFMSPPDVGDFIKELCKLNPNIVVLDTLATAIAGEDENSSKAAAFLTANGPAGRIRDAFKALVILPAHQGKDANKKVRGHSGFMGNADVVLHVEADKQAGAIRVTVEKMRDGRDGFSIYFKVPPAGSEGVPVPEKISEEAYRALTGSTSNRPDDAQLTFNERRDTLVEHRAGSFETGLPEAKFAEVLTETRTGVPRPRDNDEDAAAAWKTTFEKERKALQNAHRKKGYKGVLCGQQVPSGGDKIQWRWYVVNPEAAGIAAAPSAVMEDAATLFDPVGGG